ncbi:MAG: Nif3-like dinuclear metal center hexameric protein [Anaerolineae bacterium]|nr:Nif3-like dinuclear metal center hexameric protein [Anaerolineae bacterium]
MINQADLVNKLDTFFEISIYDERDAQPPFPPGYESVFARYAAPGFIGGAGNGLMLNNTAQVDRAYLIVFPSPAVLDTIIGREVQRGAPGALIFSHHASDYQEGGPEYTPIPEVQLEALREHHVSYYLCHAPLDCHADVSTTGALAEAIRLQEPTRFAPYHGGKAGLAGTVAPIGFHDFARRLVEALGLPYLRYGGVRNDGLPIHKVAVVAGDGGTPEFIQQAVDLGCDTFVTGEWWPWGPGDSRAKERERLQAFLRGAHINLLAVSHYGSEAVVMRDAVAEWFRENAPGVDPVFIGQEDPWR